MAQYAEIGLLPRMALHCGDSESSVWQQQGSKHPINVVVEQFIMYHNVQLLID